MRKSNKHGRKGVCILGDSMNFKAWLITNKIKQYEIAELLGISVQSVNNKVNGRVDFTLSEIKKLNAKYGVAADIFLN